MSLHHIYSDTVGSTVDITAYCRLYRWSATTDAKEGSIGRSSVVVDDPDGILDFIGHRRYYAYEDLAAASNQVVYNGFIQNAKVSRGPYRTGPGRIWTLELADQNALLHRRLMNGVDAERQAETDVARMTAWNSMTESNTIDDGLYFSSLNPVDMDAADYRTQPAGTGYVDDCAQASGKNYHVWYREPTGQFSIWYDFAASSNWLSTKRLSNVLSDVDSSTTFAVALENEAVLDRDYSRVASGIMLPFDGVAVGSNTVSGTIYVQSQETTDTFAAIDWLTPSLNVKTRTKALARANRYLADAGEGDDLINCFVELPAANVNDILAGQRIEARFEHFPLYNQFSWFRILSRTVTEISEDPTKAYRLQLELTPITIPGVPQAFTSTNLSGCEVGTWPNGSPGDGKLLVGFLAQRDASTSDATIVPIGSSLPADSEACNDDFDVAGTEWTFIDNLTITNGAGQSGQLTLAYRDSEADEPQVIRWGGVGGLSGTSRPRSHEIAISGLSGAPTVTQKGTCAMGATMTSPSITVPAAGYIFAGFNYRCTGPADGASSAFTLSAQAPAVDSTQGFQYAGFGGYSWFGYLHVDSAGTYDISLDRSNAPRGSHAAGWIMGFWPE